MCPVLAIIILISIQTHHFLIKIIPFFSFLNIKDNNNNKKQLLQQHEGATAEYPATIVLDFTFAHILKEREIRVNKLTQVAGILLYSAVLFVGRSF